MSDNNKRASLRYKPKPGTHIVYMEGFAEIKDLSLSGMFVVDADPLPAGTPIKFSLRLGTNDIPLQGIVTRCEARHGMVIQFKDITPEAKRHLKIYIAELGSPANQLKNP